MQWHPTRLPGLFRVSVDRLADERGFFGRTWCSAEAQAAGVPAADAQVPQCSISVNRRAGTLRGMHYATAPAREAKLVRCTSGAIWDVVLDLRPDSPAYLQHIGVRLDRLNREALFIPPGCAHGFLTLEDDTEVFYQMSEAFVPGAGRGVRWNDPAFGIEWPLTHEPIIHARDAAYPDFDPADVAALRGWLPLAGA